MADGNALNVCECIGSWYVNDQLMHTPAWNVIDLYVLLLGPDTRGENVSVSGLPGRTAYPMELEQTDYHLPLYLSGVYDQDGNVDPDGIYARLVRNMVELRAGVYGPTDGVTPAWPSEIIMPWGETYDVAQGVQIIEIAPVYQAFELVKTTITVRVPDGLFTLAGS